VSQPRVIAITGTSRGVGRGMAAHFAEAGWSVHGCSRSAPDFDLPQYHHAVCDVTDETQVRRWIRGIKQSAGRIDVVVCNVGLVKSALLLPLIPTELFTDFFNLSFKTTFLVCREAAKAMISQRSGRIINIGSTMTALHEPGTAAYSANKAAIVELTKVMARELAPHGVTCNVVAPSLVETDASKAMGEDWKQRMLALQTIKRPVLIEELCSIVNFFAAPESGCVTGQVLYTCLAA
jgi:3-oxoacyl-[acyl-carrier protein] reductase